MAAKINSVFNAGYYIPEDYDYRRLPKDDRQLQREQRLAERRRGRGANRAGPAAAGDDDEDAGGDQGAAAVPSVDRKTRQTWQFEFDVICDRCGQINARGTKCYANIRKQKEKYLGRIELFTLEIRCTKCGLGEILLRTDPETSSYVVVSGGRRAGGGGRDLAELQREAGAAAPAADERTADEIAHDEMTARIERHQRAALDAEAVDESVIEETRRLLFPSASVLEAVRRSHKDEASRIAQARQAADDDLLTAEDRANLRAEFFRLREAAGIKSEGPADAAALKASSELAALSASLRLDEDTVAAHDRMLAEEQRARERATAAAAAAAKPKSKTLAMLFS